MRLKWLPPLKYQPNEMGMRDRLGYVMILMVLWNCVLAEFFCYGDDSRILLRQYGRENWEGVVKVAATGIEPVTQGL